MTSNHLPWAAATELASAIGSGKTTSAEVAASMIDRIEAINPAINAYVHFDRDQVLRDAAELDRQQAAGRQLGPLHGVPYAIKCTTNVEGLPATGALKPFADRIADRDDVVVRRLRQAGGLFLGLTNAPEAGYYGGTDGHLYGPTHNPWMHGHSAGGSSGGSAAAVAAGLAPIAEGSDGAGSVRIPAAMCGIVGFKPSLGLIPHTLLPTRTATITYHGPLTRTVADAALMTDVMRGADPRDPLSFPRSPEPLLGEIGKDIDGWRVAFSEDLGLGYINPEVRSIVRSAVKAFEELGAHVEEATPDWPNPEQAMWEGSWVPVYASEYDIADWKNLGGQVDDNLIEIMREAERLTAVEVGRAEATRGRVHDAFQRFMEDYEVLISPTLASATFPLEQFAPSWLEGEPLRRRILGWLLTYPFNMVTNPAISVPAGFTSDGRPVGLQIIGRHRADGSVLRAASAFESVRPWLGRIPSLTELPEGTAGIVSTQLATT